MKLRYLFLFTAALAAAQDAGWPMYNGDYSGRRHSPLKQINSSNVKNLALV